MSTALVPQPPYEALVSDPPLGEVLAAVREAYQSGEIVTEQSYLACVNVVSFAGSKYFSGKPPVFAASHVTTQEGVDAAFKSLMPDETGTMAAAPEMESAWLLIAVEVLPMILEFLRKRRK